MTYITTRRARFNSLSGPVNIPYGTGLDWTDGIITADGMPICADHSQNAYEYFARNDDGQGLRRGALIRSIRKILGRKDKHHQDRWDKVWDADWCRKFKRPEHAEHWIWNYDFYNANIDELERIEALVKGGV